jgi:hypothetical protein
MANNENKTIEALRDLFRTGAQIRVQLASLADQLPDGPIKIRNARTSVADAKMVAGNAKIFMENREAEIQSEVAGDKDSLTGKALFSNESARNAEVNKRLALDDVYKTLRKQYEQAERHARDLSLEVERLEDERRALELQIGAISKSADLVVSASNVLSSILTHTKEQ